MVLTVAWLFQVRSILSSREKEDSNTDLLISIYNPTRNETARLHMEEKVNQGFNQSSHWSKLPPTSGSFCFLGTYGERKEAAAERERAGPTGSIPSATGTLRCPHTPGRTSAEDRLSEWVQTAAL